MHEMFLNSLPTLPLLRRGQSRSINQESKNGEKGKGGMAASKLGPSRKGSPCLGTVHAGETVTLAEMDGPGVIQHIWVTVTDTTPAGRFVLRDVVLRMYWDEETEASVEVPLGDFFCNGFARGCEVNSLAIAVNPKRGMNCFFPSDIPAFFYQVDYCLYDSLPEDIGYFHAQWRRERITQAGRDFVLLDNVRGRGQYVGTYLALTTLERYWWGEGEFKFYLDGDRDYPTLCGTGTEDYFGGAWSFGSTAANGDMAEKTYCTPFMGYPFYSRDDDFHNEYFNRDCPPMRGFYRWHIMDPILFEQDLRVELQQIGVNEFGLFERQDDVASVAYWYQSEPHHAFPAFPQSKSRWPR